MPASMVSPHCQPLVSPGWTKCPYVRRTPKQPDFKERKLLNYAESILLPVLHDRHQLEPTKTASSYIQTPSSLCHNSRALQATRLHVPGDAVHTWYWKSCLCYGRCQSRCQGFKIEAPVALSLISSEWNLPGFVSPVAFKFTLCLNFTISSPKECSP